MTPKTVLSAVLNRILIFIYIDKKVYNDFNIQLFKPKSN